MCTERAGVMKDMGTNSDVDHSLYKQQAYPSERQTEMKSQTTYFGIKYEQK